MPDLRGGSLISAVALRGSRRILNLSPQLRCFVRERVGLGLARLQLTARLCSRLLLLPQSGGGALVFLRIWRGKVGLRAVRVLAFSKRRVDFLLAMFPNIRSTAALH